MSQSGPKIPTDASAMSQDGVESLTKQVTADLRDVVTMKNGICTAACGTSLHETAMSAVCRSEQVE